MPELADVEGFRRLVAEHARGQRVRRTDVADPGVLRNTTTDGLSRAMAGRLLLEPHRHGKWLMVRTDGPVALLHFGMSGLLVWNCGQRHPHDRVVLVLDRGELRYRDQRKLQGLWLARDEPEVADVMGPQGPDALGLRRDELAGLLAGHQGRLKSVLMDQKVIAGLGNILTDEVLWRAHLHPRRAAGRLGDAELDRLDQGLQSVLAESAGLGFIPHRRSWLAGVRDDDEPRCPRCGQPLAVLRVGGRSSLWCPRCQPLQS